MRVQVRGLATVCVAALFAGCNAAPALAPQTEKRCQWLRSEIASALNVAAEVYPSDAEVPQSQQPDVRARLVALGTSALAEEFLTWASGRRVGDPEDQEYARAMESYKAKFWAVHGCQEVG